MTAGLSLRHTEVCRAPAAACGIMFIADGTAKSNFLYTMT